MEKRKVMVYGDQQEVTCMRVSGRIISKMERESMFMLVDRNIQVFLKIF